MYENLMVFAHLYRVSRPKQKVIELLRQFDLESLKDRLALRLSSGQNTRVALCKGLLNAPRLLLLDEPTAYLGPKVTTEIKSALTELRKQQGATILYTTCNMVEAEEMCSHIIFLSQGSIVAPGTPLELARSLLDSNRDLPALKEVFLQLTDPT